jgi:D-threo-aldose 1-dehydrogenase
VSVVSAAPFNSGLLAQDEPPPDATFDYRPVPAERLAAARQLAATARENGATLPQLALQFGLRHPAVAAIVVGAAAPGEIRSNAMNLGRPVPDGVWAQLSSGGVRS